MFLYYIFTSDEFCQKMKRIAMIPVFSCLLLLPEILILIDEI